MPDEIPRWLQVSGVALFVAGIVAFEDWIGYSPIEYGLYPKESSEVFRNFVICSSGYLLWLHLLRAQSEAGRPPSELNPAEIAMASVSVDLPDPFSPIKKVKGCVNSSFFKDLIAGRLKGYSSNEGTRSR